MLLLRFDENESKLEMQGFLQEKAYSDSLNVSFDQSL